MKDSLPTRMFDTVRASSSTRRFLLLGGFAAVLVGVWAVANWAIAPSYAVLYGDLAFGDAGRIAEHLEQAGISHRLESGGSAVAVPVADLARARVALAQEGLPLSGRPGLELFDKPSWGMTDFTQRVTYQRALEGELARTIAGIRGIRRAQVHLVMPNSRSLRRADRPPGASVVLTLDPNASLAAEAVQGITYIVSNSVAQITSESVAVMDDQGRVLSAPGAAESLAGLTSRQLELQQSVEEHLVLKLETLLATVLGQGRARTEVAAQLNFQQVDRTIEAFDPEGQVVQNEQRSQTDAGAGPISAGAQTVTNNSYQNSRTVETIVGAVGGIERLTVAVLVDDEWLRALPELDRAARLAGLEAGVRDAVGIDDLRGDRVSVVAVPFEPAIPVGFDPTVAEAGDGPGMDVLGIVERVGRPIVALVAIGALLMVAWRTVQLGTLPAPATTGTLGGAHGSQAVAGGADHEGAFRPEVLTKPLNRPEDTAHVIRAWLAESSR